MIGFIVHVQCSLRAHEYLGGGDGGGGGGGGGGNLHALLVKVMTKILRQYFLKSGFCA